MSLGRRGLSLKGKREKIRGQGNPGEKKGEEKEGCYQSKRESSKERGISVSMSKTSSRGGKVVDGERVVRREGSLIKEERRASKVKGGRGGYEIDSGGGWPREGENALGDIEFERRFKGKRTQRRRRTICRPSPRFPREENI